MRMLLLSRYRVSTNKTGAAAEALARETTEVRIAGTARHEVFGACCLPHAEI